MATRGYMVTDSDLKSFLKLVQGEGDAVMQQRLEQAHREGAARGWGDILFLQARGHGQIPQGRLGLYDSFFKQ